MPRPNKTMTARTILTFLLTIALAAAMLATISGDEGTEERTLPTVSISATAGTTNVTEGEDASFTVTADPAPTADTEVWISLNTNGNFADLPEPGEYLLHIEDVRMVTITAGTTQAETSVPTIDDTVDEENGSISASLIDQPAYTVGDRWVSVRVEDNDPTLPPEQMAQPTVLPIDAGLEIFWIEPAHTGEREITGYRVSWSTTSDAGSLTVGGDQRHHSLTGLTNGTEYTVRIQACKGFTQCSPESDTVTATPTDSGPTITGPGTRTLPEEAAATVGQYSATSGASTAWRLGGDDSDFFSQTVSTGGRMTLKLNAGANFEKRQSRNFDNTFEVTVVATGNSSDQASSSAQVSVTVTDVDETPVFSPASITKPPYRVGEQITTFLLPVPKADETPITYAIEREMGRENLPPGLTWFGTRGISGTPTLAGDYTTIYTATDRDGDIGRLSIQFTVVETANNAPTVAAEIDNLHMNPGGSTVTIDLSDKFLDPDGDTLIYTATSDNTSVATTMISGSMLTLTPVAEGTATISVAVFDRGLSEPGRLSVSQEFTVTVNQAAIAITPTGTSLGRGASEILSVTGTNLDPTQTYSLEATLDGEEAAFNRDCTDRTTTGELATVLTGPRVKSFVIHGCNLGDAEITVKLSLGTDELSSATATATVTGVPDKPVISTKATTDGIITLEIELGHSVDSFEVQQYQGTTPTTLPFGTHTLARTLTSTGNTGPTTAEATVGELLNGVEYRYKVVSNNPHGTVASDDYVVPLQPVPPANLDLEPRPLRHAAIAWDGLANSPAIKYTVDIRSIDNTLVRPLTTDLVLAKEVALDDLIDSAGANTNDPKGLGHSPYAWLIRIKAQGIPGSALNDSAYSENLVVVDSPITVANGNSTPGSQGQVKLTWTPIENVLGDLAYANGQYHFRYRPLEGNDTLPNWNPHNYGNSITTPKVSSTSTHTIGNLDQDRIYAVQLRYELPKQPGAKEPVRVYAARDIYARPASSQPTAERTASYPMFGHWSSKELHYTICTNTFPVTSGNETWPGLIKHAFREWQAASADLITMFPTESTCLEDGTPLQNLASAYNSTNEVYLVSERTFDSFLPELMEMFIYPLHVCIETSARACVISPDYHTPGNGPSLDLEREEQIGGQPATGVDMLIKHSVTNRTSPTGTPEPNIPGGNDTWGPGDVRFNTCESSPQPRDEDEEYRAYALTVHEAGHMLGLSNIEREAIITNNQRGQYEMSHPTLPDSAMNYDVEIPHFWDSGITRQGNQLAYEPDCSPHPFDILALYSLYQNVR